MIKNYIKMAWRTLLQNKMFSLINILGLAIGMAAAAFIILWVQHEYSFEQFHQHKDRIFEVWNKNIHQGKISNWNVTPKVMASVLKKDYDEIEKTVRVNYDFPILFTYQDKRIKANCNIVDSGFLEVFSFPLIKGDKHTCMNDPSSVVIGKDLAAKLFGDQDPIGKIVKLDNQYDFKISAVLDQLPNNTSFTFECLVPWRFLTNIGGDDTFWGNNSTTTYAMLRENVNVSALQEKIKNLRSRYDKEEPQLETFLYPITRSRLHGVFKNGIETGGRIVLVKTFIAVALFLLIIACVNFMNLSTAKSEKRAKEVGIRKVVGAMRISLIKQFFIESILISCIAGGIAYLIIIGLLPYFNELIDKNLTIDIDNYMLFGIAIVFIVFTGLLAGSYPAVFLSSFNPVSVLKGTFKKVHAFMTPRKVLVIGQFAFSVILIIATLVISQQIKYAQSRDTGFDKDRLIYHMMEGDIEKNYLLIKNELINTGIASSVTKTMSPITEGWSNSNGMQWEGKDPNNKTLIDRFSADDGVAKTLGLQLVAGRDMDLKTYKTDSNATIINESLVKLLGVSHAEQAIGKTINDSGEDWHIIGVVQDFILRSPYRPIVPTMIQGAKSWFQVIHVKYKEDKPMNEALAAAELIFKKYNPEYPFNYTFVDTEYEKKYSDEKRIGRLANLFAGLTIFISCLGLFGLVSYMASSRTKELGLRKVLGASVANVVTLLSKDFLILVAIAFVISSPIAYWLMNKWLADYAYRIEIKWWVFGLAGITILCIAMFTVGIQAIRAALANPAKSIRTQ